MNTHIDDQEQQAINAAMAQDFEELLQRLASDYGIHIDFNQHGLKYDRAWGYHRHAPDGTCLFDDTSATGFPTVASAIMAALNTILNAAQEPEDSYIFGLCA
jgi:hypothetical protein